MQEKSHCEVIVEVMWLLKFLTMYQCLVKLKTGKKHLLEVHIFAVKLKDSTLEMGTQVSDLAKFNRLDLKWLQTWLHSTRRSWWIFYTQLESFILNWYHKERTWNLLLCFYYICFMYFLVDVDEMLIIVIMFIVWENSRIKLRQSGLRNVSSKMLTVVPKLLWDVLCSPQLKNPPESP